MRGLLGQNGPDPDYYKRFQNGTTTYIRPHKSESSIRRIRMVGAGGVGLPRLSTTDYNCEAAASGVAL